MHVEYECNNVGPDYFQTIGIPVLRGREFSARDQDAAQRVVIVNEAFSRAVFGNMNAVGHTITDNLDHKPKQIVGVVKDSRYFTLGEKQRLAVYEPYFASGEPINVHFLIRMARSPVSYVKPVSDLLGHLDASAAIEVKPMSQTLGFALLPSRAGAVLLGSMGILGLALAAAGLYGVLLYTVSRRTREIGVRVALGATPSAVLRMICRQSCVLVGSGLATGLILAYFATQPLAMFLVPGLSTFDSSAFLAVIGVLGSVALFATIAPATRALRVDPMTALRYE